MQKILNIVKKIALISLAVSLYVIIYWLGLFIIDSINR